ncbi:MAG: thiamine-phosphate kinase, partial [Planctomycetota bacterium]
QYIQNMTRDESHPLIHLGVGDDCAVFDAGDTGQVLISTDMLIEGVHYSEGESAELVGRKAIARAFSDVAAMAARPVACLVAISFPPGCKTPFTERICTAVLKAANELNAPVIGGDVSSGTDRLTISVTVCAAPNHNHKSYITRAGARCGDAICVTGRLGGAIQSGRHLTFQPRIQEALYLNQRFDLHAMIDISDGLSTDLRHLCDASQKGAVIQAESIPIHEDLLNEFAPDDLNQEKLIRRALSDGEDYELLLCMPANQAPDLNDPMVVNMRTRNNEEQMRVCSDGEKTETHHGIEVSERREDETGTDQLLLTRIGTCEADEQIVLEWSRPAGKQEIMESTGWEHRT